MTQQSSQPAGFLAIDPEGISLPDGPWRDGQPGVRRDCDPFPQPAPAHPEHHAPNPNAPGRFPVVNSKAGWPIATAVLFEDEEIIVWENRICSGMYGPLHSHDNDYWIVSTWSTGDRSNKSFLKRSPKYRPAGGGMGPQVIPGKTGPGGVIFVKKGHTETADNPEPNPMSIVYLCEIKTGGTKAAHPQGWGGAVNGVLFENTEMKVWDMRVPAGQKSSVPVGKENHVYHVDVHGKRQGAQDVADMLNAKEGDQVGSLKKSKLDAYMFPKKTWGSMYARDPSKDVSGAGEAFNDGTEDYRGIIFEMKPIDRIVTARL